MNSHSSIDSDRGASQVKHVDSAYRNWISREPRARFPPATGRYHLYVAFACPWAHRTLIVRALKGLEDVISVTVVHPVWQKTKPDDPEDTHTGWVFGNKDGQPFVNTIGKGGPFLPCYPGNEPDPIHGARTIRDIYELSNDTEGKYTVPILWDKQLSIIVSNDSSEIIRMLNSEFNEFAKNPDLDLYPEELREEIDDVNGWVLPTLNSGVYRCGNATNQAAYDEAIDIVTRAFDRVESILKKRRFLVSDTSLTEADVRLFVTLIRFDEAYSVHFKTNTRSVTASPALLNYCRAIYQMPRVAETVNMQHIKLAYYCSNPIMNHYSIVPRGTNFEMLLKQAIAEVPRREALNGTFYL